MATIDKLTGETIDTSYGTLLMVTNTAGIGGSIQTVQSGLGTDPDNLSALKLSTTVVGVNGSLGVGLDSPEYVIHAQTADDYVGKFESTDAGASIILEDNGSTTDGNRITVTSDALSVATANVTALTVDSSQRVGIGGTATTEKLEVYGNALLEGASPALNINATSGAGQINVKESGTVRCQQAYDSGNDLYYIYAGNAQALVLGAGNAERMRISADGSVGLGTDSPTSLLHLKSSSSTEPEVKIENVNDDASSAEIRIQKTTASPAAADEIGQIAFTCSDTSGGTRFASNIRGIIGAVGSSNVDGALTFSTYVANTEYERARIDSAGYIGFGTGSDALDCPFKVKSAESKLADFHSTTTDSYILIRDQNDRLYVGSDYGIGFFGGTTGAHSNNLNIDLVTGSVGIGTDSPATGYALDVNGKAVVRDDLELWNDYCIQDFRKTNGTDRLGWILNRDDATCQYVWADGQPLLFATTTTGGSTTERMRISAAGNIGTANAFHVTNGGSATAGNAFYSPASNEVGISSNGVEAIRVDGSQNVGIGTDSPAAGLTLDVAGKVGTIGGSAAAPSHTFNDDVDTGMYRLSGADGIGFSTGGTNRVSIDSSGNVIIANMPTSDPAIAGALWSDSGTVKISAG